MADTGTCTIEVTANGQTYRADFPAGESFNPSALVWNTMLRLVQNGTTPSDGVALASEPHDPEWEKRVAEVLRRSEPTALHY